MRWCNGKVEVQDGLEGLDVEATSLRLRLVNGSVWINDLSTGDSAVLGPDGEIQRLDDWGAAFGTEQQPNEPPDKNENDDDELNDDEAIVENEDLPEIDEDDKNQPPIAIPDEARTRVDQPSSCRCSTTTVIPTATSSSSPI